MSKPFLCTVKYPCSLPKEFMGKLKVNVAFVANDQRVMDHYTHETGKDLFRVNAKAETPKHRVLRALRLGQEVYLVKDGEYEGNPYFAVAEGSLPAPALRSNNSHKERAVSDVQRVAELYWQIAIEISLAFDRMPEKDQELLKSGIGQVWPGPTEIQKIAMSVFIKQSG